MWGNNCTLFMVASMTADDTNQRAVLRNPGVIAKRFHAFVHSQKSLCWEKTLPES